MAAPLSPTHGTRLGTTALVAQSHESKFVCYIFNNFTEQTFAYSKWLNWLIIRWCISVIFFHSTSIASFFQFLRMHSHTYPCLLRLWNDIWSVSQVQLSTVGWDWWYLTFLSWTNMSCYLEIANSLSGNC